MRSSVDLPQPDGPTNTTNSPESIVEVDAVDHLVAAVGLRRTFDAAATCRPCVGCTRRRAVCARPASTIRFWPVIARASSEARNSAVRATSSSDSAELEALLLEERLAPFPASAHSAFWRSVTIAPGTIELTRMLCAPSSRASVRVRPLIAALAVVYAARSRDAAHPRHRAEVDDRSAARRRHRRRDRLRGEEMMAQVDRQVLVPVLRRHVRERVAIVARRVVDEHADRAHRGLRGADRRLERRDVATSQWL